MSNNPPYNPYYQPSVPYVQQHDDEAKAGLIQNKDIQHAQDDVDVESEMDSGESCIRHICTVFGAWAFFGGLYWVALTLWGWKFASNDRLLYYWAFGSCGLACICIAIVFVGIAKGIQLGDSNAVKWVLPYCLVSMVNIWVHTYFARSKDLYLPYSIAFIVCDFVSLLYISFTFYGFHITANRWFRAQNFLLEWFDLLSQIAVAVLYYHYSESTNSGIITNLFWIFILLQLFVWVLPIILGSGTTKKSCLRQLFVLDILTDTPLMVINIVSGAFLLQYWILVDLIVKIGFMGRYFYVFLKYFKHSELKANPWQVFIFCPYVCRSPN